MAQKNISIEWSSMKDFTVIKNNNDLDQFIKYLSVNNIEILSIDLESESNLHIYGEKLCLVQIYDGKRYFLIDPFDISRDGLAKLFEDKRIVKYFYGCESDLSLVYKQYQIKIKSVFDIKNMVDVLGLEKKGLDSVVSEIIGITSTSNKKKYQMYNWTLRPIKTEALEYALSDVEYLFELYKKLMEKIIETNKYNELIHYTVMNRNEFDSKSIPTVFKSLEYKELRNSEKELFKKIYDIRDKYAQELNVPANVVIAKEYMFKIVLKKIELEKVVFDKKVSDKLKNEIIQSLRGIM
jgi:ribonuclease D